MRVQRKMFRLLRLTMLAGLCAGLPYLTQSSVSGAGEPTAPQEDIEALLTGKARPHQVPPDWVGSRTKSAPGWRWDDPHNSGNSVRIFRGDPSNPDPTKRRRNVVVNVVRKGAAVTMSRKEYVLKGAPTPQAPAGPASPSPAAPRPVGPPPTPSSGPPRR